MHFSESDWLMMSEAMIMLKIIAATQTTLAHLSYLLYCCGVYGYTCRGKKRIIIVVVRIKNRRKIWRQKLSGLNQQRCLFPVPLFSLSRRNHFYFSVVVTIVNTKAKQHFFFFHPSNKQLDTVAKLCQSLFARDYEMEASC